MSVEPMHTESTKVAFGISTCGHAMPQQIFGSSHICMRQFVHHMYSCGSIARALPQGCLWCNTAPWRARGLCQAPSTARKNREELSGAASYPCTGQCSKGHWHSAHRARVRLPFRTNYTLTTSYWIADTEIHQDGNSDHEQALSEGRLQQGEACRTVHVRH